MEGLGRQGGGGGIVRCDRAFKHLHYWLILRWVRFMALATFLA